MVADGFAWRYPQFDKPGEFAAAESDAGEHKRGLTKTARLYGFVRRRSSRSSLGQAQKIHSCAKTARGCEAPIRRKSQASGFADIDESAQFGTVGQIS
jgi:hypothetical protein